MRIVKIWIARLISLLIISAIFLLLNFIITSVIGKSLAKNLLQDEQIKTVIDLIVKSNVDYQKINIIMNSKSPQPPCSFYIFAFILSTFVVASYSSIMRILKKILQIRS